MSVCALSNLAVNHSLRVRNRLLFVSPSRLCPSSSSGEWPGKTVKKILKGNRWLHPAGAVNTPSAIQTLPRNARRRYSAEGFFGCRNPICDYEYGRDWRGDGGGPRLFFIGSHANDAVIIGDYVYEIYPYHVKEYTLENIDQKASTPSRDPLIETARESGRFFQQ
jgi:hypothetical protein